MQSSTIMQMHLTFKTVISTTSTRKFQAPLFTTKERQVMRCEENERDIIILGNLLMG